MRKIIYVIICCYGLTAMADENCIGGFDLTYRNEHTYCVSEDPMNWWSAFQWCKAQGRYLASLDEICDYQEETWRTSGIYCPNKNSIDPHGRAVWTSLGHEKGTAYALHIGGGTIMSDRSITDTFLAICY